MTNTKENKIPESGELKEKKLNPRQELFCQ